MNAYAIDSFIYKNNHEVKSLNIGKNISTINNQVFPHYNVLNYLNYQSFKFVLLLLME